MASRIDLKAFMCGGRVAEMAVLCRQIGIDPPLFNQPRDNVNDRTAELDCIPACPNLGFGIVANSLLASNALTGKCPLEQVPKPTTGSTRGTGG